MLKVIEFQKSHRQRLAANNDKRVSVLKTVITVITTIIITIKIIIIIIIIIIILIFKHNVIITRFKGGIKRLVDKLMFSLQRKSFFDDMLEPPK